jgi:hypothetical protein
VPARDFCARITRQSRSHGLTARARRKLVNRRMGVLVLATAVPAMAAPSLQTPQTVLALTPQVIAPMEPAFARFSARDRTHLRLHRRRHRPRRPAVFRRAGLF